MCTKNPNTEQELVSSFLQKLIMGDYEARYVRVQSKNKNNEYMHNNENSNYDDFLKHDDTLSHREGLATNTKTHIHPMDLQMTIYHCGDNFVRQYIYNKLSFCQFALPLLVPNPCSSEIEFPLWAFRQINKNWKCRDTSTNTLQTKNCAIVNADTPLVSFIRFGESPTSKSQMLNSLLSQQRHGVFFHRHCKGGSSRNGLLMEGVTEVAWYCPGGRDDDVFNDCIAFTNLHGDARRHRKQVQFLHEISSINVILMSDNDLNDEAKIILQECLKSSKPLICLWADKENLGGGHSRTKVKIAVKNRNEAELLDELKSTLNSLLANLTETINLKDCSNIAGRHCFTVDEDDENCKVGKFKADDFLSFLNGKSLSSMKETFLPLQGKLWHEWCNNDKELTRLRLIGDHKIEKYRGNILMANRSLRRDQLLKAFPLNDVMKTLIEILQRPSDKVKKYFLHWLKIYLDKEIIKIKKEKDKSSLLVIKQAELQKISQKRDAFSFGIDHIFREVGQIYEASQTPHGAVKRSAALPGIAADLMLSGFPLELMDGDASHVPLSWISSVLDKVIEKIEDKKLFVLSILGIQSSGKSTLLNAMFGLQFPVGAGRCTRGAYMQLVTVEKELTTELGFDFVLIVDTEGLRAPELSNSTPTHDNELATFVIGLGNTTVINIFGENPSEMQDILQIAVQAFLRMKQVKMSPSCVFVHQNVGDVTVQAKNEDGRASLQDKLDEMTRLAAQQEQIAVGSFDEVIRFDVDSHIRYFANLWEGNPPMAPPNQVYCQNVQDLKEILLNISKRERNVLKISEFKTRIQDLWTALLAENFVFSFKNTLEIAAYSELENMYGKWTWSLRSHLIEEENKQEHISVSSCAKTTMSNSSANSKQLPAV
ncbi:interferon-induced very large GTPase 1-like [Lampetra fluviatilis]